MNNPNPQQSPALRMEAWSINCILLYASLYAANRNLLTIAWLLGNESEGRTDSLTAHYAEYLFLMRLMLLIHTIRRNARIKLRVEIYKSDSINKIKEGK